MNRTELIRFALQMTEGFTLRLMDDLKQFPLVQPTSNGGNHPLWTMGHLAFLEGGIHALVTDTEHPTQHWAPLFAAGTQPLPDASKYPPLETLISTYQDFRAKNIQALNAMDETEIDRKPKHVPPGFEDSMRTKGQTLLLISLHQMHHAGQLANCRHVAGFKPYI